MYSCFLARRVYGAWERSGSKSQDGAFNQSHNQQNERHIEHVPLIMRILQCLLDRSLRWVPPVMPLEFRPPRLYDDIWRFPALHIVCRRMIVKPV